MTDEAAIRLFVADGGLERDWHLVDEVARLHYRLAAQKNRRVVQPRHTLLPDTPQPLSQEERPALHRVG